MDPIILIIAVVVSYLAGSISFARVIVRLVSGEDVTQFRITMEGSGESYRSISVGGNTVSSRLGAKYGMLTGILDILKAVVMVLIFRLLYPAQPIYHLAAGLAVMAGHIWPVYYKFDGGSGWSPAIGALLVIDPLSIPATVAAGLLLGLVILRSAPISMIAWIWLLIPWFWLRTHNPLYIGFAVGVNLLFILAMIPEIKLMLKYGHEGKLNEYQRTNMHVNPMSRGFLKIARLFGVKEP